jgi:hypothetical protein
MSFRSHDDLTGDPDVGRPLEHIELAYTGGYKTPGQGKVQAGEHAIPEDLEGIIFQELREYLTGGRDTAGRIKSERTPGGAAVTYADDSGFQLSKASRAYLDEAGYTAPWAVIF